MELVEIDVWEFGVGLVGKVSVGGIVGMQEGMEAGMQVFEVEDNGSNHCLAGNTGTVAVVEDIVVVVEDR